MTDSEHRTLNGTAPDDGSDEQPTETDESAYKKSTKYDSGAKDLERVTDYVEEEEILNSNDLSSGRVVTRDGPFDLTFKALQVIGSRRIEEAAEKQKKESELAKIQIKKEDVDLIVKEMEISRTTAERTLREHSGDVVKALTALVD
ncbi:huntingtin-interacting protein K isoform X1 [Bemisia tabaci]|uniref:huntingtin-interacting protein K isoform X1 n=1 Tax=Bemisia tabaci TaxID=7038 RepID=UPI0008F9BC23|nr:PREDICTED: huntingtin-interacting protein K isoform X1 [Bemisia tabaci]